MPPRRPSISIICVFNDPAVRARCLDRSVRDLGAGKAIEYLPIDNTHGQYASAGGALNAGARLAAGGLLVFAHQDVFLHSRDALERAARVAAADPSIGVLGAIGVDREGRLRGRVRDRVLLLGEPAAGPVDVDCVDELLFAVPRELHRREPLSERPELAWHAYAVEYGIRVRAHGRRVCAMDLGVTHNSLTVNVERLDVAYLAIAHAYPGALPLHTPGGRLTGRPPRRSALVARHGWRRRWLAESLRVRPGARTIGGFPPVLSDIRMDIDHVLAMTAAPLVVLNLDGDGRADVIGAAPLQLERGGKHLEVASVGVAELTERIAARDPAADVLLTNLTRADLSALAPRLARQPRRLGFRHETGFWLLSGPVAATLPARWRRPDALPAPWASR